MKYVFVNKEEGYVYCVRNKVKEFDDGYKCSKYFNRNKLKEKGFKIVVIGIEEEKNNECLKYL